MSDAPQVPNTQNPQPVGPIVATIIIVLLLALGGLYVFVTQVNKIHSEAAVPNA